MNLKYLHYNSDAAQKQPRDSQDSRPKSCYFAIQLTLHYSKENVYKNSALIYNLNERLEFPFSFLSQEFEEDKEALVYAKYHSARRSGRQRSWRW